MEIRHATHPSQVSGFATADLRGHYLVEDLFPADRVRLVYSHQDRTVVGGVAPSSPVRLESPTRCAASTSCERRELGMVNVGAAGAGDRGRHAVRRSAHRECLYVGARRPRGRVRPRRRVLPGLDARARRLPDGAGTAWRTLTGTARRRRGLQRPHDLQAHPRGRRAQLPARPRRDGAGAGLHVEHDAVPHPRPAYRGLPVLRPAADHRVVHLMGRPDETRNLIVADRQAVISPPWSVHCGFGTPATRSSGRWAGRTRRSTTWTTSPYPLFGEDHTGERERDREGARGPAGAGRQRTHRGYLGYDRPAQSTVHRILQSLVEHRFALNAGDGHYIGGPRILTLAGRLMGRFDPAQHADGTLRRLREDTGYTVHFGLLAGDDVVYAAKVEGKKPYRMPSRVGMSVRLHRPPSARPSSRR